MGYISYKKLLQQMENQNLTTYKIRKEKIISESTMQNIRVGKGISTDAIGRLCEALHCQPGDLMEYVPDEPILQTGPNLVEPFTIRK